MITVKTLDTTSTVCSTFARNAVQSGVISHPDSDHSIPPISSPRLNRFRDESSTILLVEDDSALREMLGTYLTGLGYNVLEASNGIEALGLFQSHHDAINLVFTDVDMPIMDGLQLAREIRGIDLEIPIVITSGNIPEEVNVGGKPYTTHILIKPYPLDVLEEKLKECLETV